MEYQWLYCLLVFMFFLSAYCQSLKKVGKDSTVLLICITVFLSYLPEAGQYSSFFLYLRQVGNVCLVSLEHEENQRLGSI